jgi:hypothetical protein
MYTIFNLVIKVPPPPKPKKTDPVSKYHSLQQTWNKDHFLKRISNKQTGFREIGRWGGMATVPVETVTKPYAFNNFRKHHNLAQKRPNYVIPSEKDRRDVIWDVRSKLAIIDRN